MLGSDPSEAEHGLGSTGDARRQGHVLSPFDVRSGDRRRAVREPSIDLVLQESAGVHTFTTFCSVLSGFSGHTCLP